MAVCYYSPKLKGILFKRDDCTLTNLFVGDAILSCFYAPAFSMASVICLATGHSGW